MISFLSTPLKFHAFFDQKHNFVLFLLICFLLGLKFVIQFFEFLVEFLHELTLFLELPFFHLSIVIESFFSAVGFIFRVEICFSGTPKIASLMLERFEFHFGIGDEFILEMESLLEFLRPHLKVSGLLFVPENDLVLLGYGRFHLVVLLHEFFNFPFLIVD